MVSCTIHSMSLVELMGKVFWRMLVKPYLCILVLQTILDVPSACPPRVHAHPVSSWDGSPSISGFNSQSSMIPRHFRLDSTPIFIILFILCMCTFVREHIGVKGQLVGVCCLHPPSSQAWQQAPFCGAHLTTQEKLSLVICPAGSSGVAGCGQLAATACSRLKGSESHRCVCLLV